MINEIIHADVLDGLKQIESDSVALSVQSPPYNVAINYDNRSDNQPYQEYLGWLSKVFTEVYRVTKDGGRCAINIDAMTNRQDDKDKEYVRPIYAHLCNLMEVIGWKFRTEICWYKQNGVGKATAWGSWMSCSNPVIIRNHEYVLVWSKGDWKLDGDSEQSDITKEEWEKMIYSTWFISPETRKLNNHPAAFPEELVRRIIKLFSYRGDTVLDTFVGTGTTAYVAKLLKRHYIGIDNSENCCKYARDRIETADSMFEEDYIPRSKRIEGYRKDKDFVEKTDRGDLFGE